MNINANSFLRDNKWILVPTSYFLLLFFVSIVFLSINSSHEHVNFEQDEIDGIALGAEFLVDTNTNLYSSQSDEYSIVSTVLGSNDFQLGSNTSLLQNLSNVSSLYAVNHDNKVVGIGYIASNVDDCKKLRAISISNLGKHYMSREDRSVSETISWTSKKNKFTFFNQFLSNGTQLGNVCTYLISNR